MPNSISGKHTISDTNSLCYHYLNKVYYAVKQTIVNHQENALYETYGEILYPSVSYLLTLIEPRVDDIFVDLGSGVGRLVVQVFLTTLVKQAYGIEIVDSLHQQALLARQCLLDEVPDFFANDRQLNFRLGSFLEIPLHAATIAMVCSTCYSLDMTDALGHIINDTASIHTVLSLRPLSTLQRLAFRRAVHVECSWDSALCYLYTNRHRVT